MVRKLRVNFAGGRLVFQGKVTGRRYEYIPERDKGELLIDDLQYAQNVINSRDVPGLLEMTGSGGCGCTNDGEDAVSSSKKIYNLFEEII